MRHVARIITGLMVAATLLAWAAAAWAGPAPAAPAEDPMVKGLRDRGLTTLLELYLKQNPTPVIPSTSPGTSQAGTVGQAAPGSNKAMLAAAESKEGDARTVAGERETHFEKACTYYLEAIDEAGKAVRAGKDFGERAKLRVQVLRWRLDLANMIFLKWLKTDLDFLEVTDRRGGDRAHAIKLMKVAAEQFQILSNESASLLLEVDQMPAADRLKFLNTGSFQLRSIQREASYGGAWVAYYYGWVLPADFKPATKEERSKADYLNDAITALKEYTALPDKNAAKYNAYMVIGMAYRELGKYDAALESFSQADQCGALKDEVAKPLKIRLSWERALTLLRKGDFANCRKAIDDARTLWKGELEKSLHGKALPMIEGESYIVEGMKTSNDGFKEKGAAILNGVAKWSDSWAVLVQAVITDLFPDTVASADAPPLQIWLGANDAMQRGKGPTIGEVKDPKQLQKAVDLFKKYLDKVGPKDANYADATYRLGACLLSLDRPADAAQYFYKVANDSPTYQYAKEAAQYYVNLCGIVYEKEKNEKNRLAYEKSLKWFSDKYGKDVPDQQFFYAMVLQDAGGEKVREAAAEFAKVSEKADHYVDSRYWIVLCHLKYFREIEVTRLQPADLLARARVISKELVDFSDYALQTAPKLTDDAKKAELLDWAQKAYFNAPDILMYREVGLPKDALPLLTTIETKFQIDDETRGKVLRYLIEAHQKSGNLAAATEVLDRFLKVAPPDQVGGVLRGLSKGWIDQVRGLVDRGKKAEAATQVDQAKAIGERLREWLTTNKAADAKQIIDANRLDLAELYLAVGNYVTAQAIYHELGGPKPWVVDPKKGEKLNIDIVLGLARSYEGMADAAPDPAQGKQNYETAFEIWSVILGAYEALDTKDKDAQAVWDYRYHTWRCRFRIDPQKNAKEIHDALKAMSIISAVRLGGNDAALQKKIADLLVETAKAGGEAPAAPPETPAAAPTAPEAAPPAAADAPAPAAAKG